MAAACACEAAGASSLISARGCDTFIICCEVSVTLQITEKILCVNPAENVNLLAPALEEPPCLESTWTAYVTERLSYISANAN